MLIVRLLDEYAKDDLGNPFEQGDHPLVDEARAFLVASPDSSAEPVKWGDPETVGGLIAQLQTLPADMPIHAGFHAQYQGKSRAFARSVTLSRERVVGRFIDSMNKDVPHTAVIWSQPVEPLPPDIPTPTPTSPIPARRTS